MYAYYYPQPRYGPDFWVAVIGVVLTAGIAAIAIYNASTNKETLDVTRKHYGARSAP